MKKLFLGLALTALASGAYAADPAADQVVVDIPTYNWTGFHMGVGLGGQFTSSASSALADDDYTDTFLETQGDLDAAAAFVTLDAGYDYQMQNWVVGAFANLDFSSGSDSHGVVGGEDDDSFSSRVEWGNSWGVGARVGYLVNQRILLYALGGYGQQEITATNPHTIDSGNDNQDDRFETGGWQGSGFVGGGIEALLRENLSLKAEYRYAHYSGFSGSGEAVGVLFADEDDFQSADVDDTESHTIRAVLSLRFGTGG
jgi:outer membrane immunogenic protein